MEFKRIVGAFPVAFKEIEDLVAAATVEMNTGGEKQGFYDQTLESIASHVFRGTGDFWLIFDGEKAFGYAVCSISRDIDNRLTYWGNQAYAAPSIRRHPVIKQLWSAVRAYAKERACKHFMVISSRSTKGYLRYLGKNWHVYATILKEDI